jgi:hypothetical protein
MKDFLGQELRIGDNVVIIRNYSSSTNLYKAKVTGFGKTQVLLDGGWLASRKDPDKLIKIDTILNNMNND